MPASSYAAFAIESLKGVTASLATPESVEKCGISMTVCGNAGVTVDTARTRTGSAMPLLFAYSADVSTTAAPPSLVAQISTSRNGSATIGEARMSSTEKSLRYRALGLARPCRAFFARTSAKSRSVAPYRAMRRRAYSAKYVGLVAPSSRKRSQSGSSGRSPAFGARNPFGVVSAPTTRATSQKPARIWARAVASAVAPDAHAAYDDATGAPVQPSAWLNVAADT